MPETGDKPGGLTASLERMIGSLLALGQNRMQLFAVEVQSEKLRLLDRLLKQALAIAMAMVALLLGTATLALFVWEKARYTGLLVLTGVYVAVAVFLLWRLRNDAQREPVPFEKTVAEFKKDRECFTGRN